MRAEAPVQPRGAEQAFADMVTRHGRGLGRLAYLLLGDEHAAEDLTADVLLAAWRQWAQVSQAQYPLAYLRQMMVNQAAARFRRRAKERLGLERLRDAFTHTFSPPDTAAVVDVQSALLRLPPRRRACLVLRYAFDLSEREVAETLGVTVGTVKSQTSKAVTQFRREIGEDLVHDPGASPASVPASHAGRGRHA